MKEMDETQGLEWLGEDEISQRRLRQRKRYDRLTPTQRAEKIQKTMQNRKRKCNAHYISPNINLGRQFSDGQTQKPSPNPPFGGQPNGVRNERFCTGVDGSDTKKVSCREYYCYKLQIRDDDPSVLLLSGRLLQQYVVDMYIKLENTRLDYFRQKQSDIRAELYQGIVDSVLAGESRGSMVGKRVVLPGSFVGGPRDMRRRYLDAIALVQRFGKLDLFITMTCNPDWKEIKDSLEQGQLAQDRPDLTARVFQAKLKDLKDQLFKKCIFGKVAAHVHVIEFQKRGLPHAHMLIILKSESKITSSDKFDQFVCAEIPNPNQFPDLYEKVAKHMMHGSCGVFNKKNPCMRGGKCKNHYPRSFAEETVQGEDSYPIYRRRKDSFTVRDINHVRRPTSYADLLTVNGVKCSSFKEAAEKRGLLQTDNWLSECLADAASFQMPQALHNLFAVILVYCDPSDVRKLWQDYYEPMSEDFLRLEGVNEELRLLKTLKSVDMFLESIGKSIKDFDLPAIKSQIVEIGSVEKREALDELAVKNPPEDCMAPANLNPEQKYAHNIILDHVNNNRNCSFFIDGPGGSGKTYLYRALLATIRSNGMIALATAASGVAASILPGGRTAHSRFKIPIDGNDSSVCNIPKQSGTAELIRRAKLIIWDEAPMAKRWAIEALDRSLKDIMSNNSLFGGKVIVFGGDFRQVLPVVPRGNGVEPTVDENMIEIPEEMVVRYEGRSCESCLINAVFPSLKENANSAEYITHHAILATRNESVGMLNDKLIATFPGEEWKYVSYDEAIDDTHCYYPEESNFPFALNKPCVVRRLYGLVRKDDERNGCEWAMCSESGAGISL
ncbi:hypothetical protein RHMOL_Rhmol04G0146700 [Rhododendron molle]|uniref:Uncharacterized protein n=1 Tax=Rhododendron molle TaxID=49168 RepID=A0ACC0P208_RHOML|nr:hypothetical protein RHMOL_Rhmol04G0146700 [Rhododendron molle]